MLNIVETLFYVFSSLAIIGASLVVFSRNSVRAVLFLVWTFLSTAGLWMLLEAEFLSITLILVYVGAVMVLFLFVVMMLDVELAAIREGYTRYVLLGSCMAVLVILALVFAVGERNFNLQKVAAPLPHLSDYSNVKALGILLYEHYLYPFLLAGVLLLVAIIAAITLTFRGRQSRKAIEAHVQISTRKEDRIRLMNITKEGDIR